MEQVKDQGGVQGDFVFLPKWAIVDGVLWGSVADQVMHPASWHPCRPRCRGMD